MNFRAAHWKKRGVPWEGTDREPGAPAPDIVRFSDAVDSEC